MKKHFTRIFSAFIASWAILFVFASCSTKKNTFTRRAYHNLTTHYNVYWNGMESFKGGVNSLQDNVVDNYNMPLHTVNYGAIEDARKIYSQMDRAIEKAGIAIPRHSMLFRNKEYNRWIDDCYLLIGKAQFYKQDFASARKTFDFVSRQYQDSPSELEAKLWTIRSFIQQKRYEDATARLEELEALMNKRHVPFSIKKQVPLVYAEYYIQTGNWQAAKSYLQQSVELNSNRKLRARLYFILGQLAQREKDYPAATQYYTRVIKSPAPFEMIFNARINLARSFDVNTGDMASLEKQLKKMLRDGKNADYRDKIYFALSELAQLDNNDTLVTHYLRLSVATSVKDNYQKSSSALLLADRYFKMQKYEDAAAYYDTTVQSLPKDHPDYDAITTRTQVLSELVANLRTVQVEDSLQRMAALPESQLNVVIRKIIDDYIAEEKRLKEEEERAQQEIAMARSMPNLQNENMNAIGGGGWYFYNPSAVSFGYSEFMRKWGRRKLEDNWRLSNKRQVVTFDEEEKNPTASTDSTAQGPAANKTRPADPKDPKTYLDQLPRTPEALARSNKLIALSLLNLGYIYKDGLKDIPHSIEAFEDFAKRFPDSKDLAKIYYQLYLIGAENDDTGLADKYKQLLLSGFAGSDYAEILRNPEYNNELLAKRNRIESLYNETYNAYNRGQYRMVLLYCDQAGGISKDKEIMPRFQFLKAMAIGKTVSTDSMVVLLNKLILTSPNHPVTPVAQELVGKYGKTAGSPGSQAQNAPPASNGQATSAATPIIQPGANPGSGISPFATSDTLVPDVYKFNMGQPHFYILMLNEKYVNVNATKIRVSDFVAKNFGNAGLTQNSIVLDGGWQMITVSSFKNGNAAMDFFRTIRDNVYVMGQMGKDDFRQVVISMENYPVFYRERKYNGYLNFFKKYYLDNKE